MKCLVKQSQQNSLEGEISERTLPYINPTYRPPPKPPNMKNMEEEKKIWCYRPPPRLPNKQNTGKERIGVPEKNG